ncbi:MAG: sporulation protein YqfD [Thermanaeromonas sp.]|uniref:sporulation protein YqfD n=1 Tax=Thermanaeromonas sp. TaxID=2003697 RepID=UPI0024383A68|nr:sporulation protein YqfD [Thermanaeromonas sp.]MCG0277555.1 sporulation protein YqfD [Thermanaeromonas sp.]
MRGQDWQAFFKNYVVIEVEGNNLEEFLDVALHQGVIFWDIIQGPGPKFRAKIPVACFAQLRPVARKTRCRVRLMDKRGIIFWWQRVKTRQSFLAGAVLFLLGLLFLSNFVWAVDVLPRGELKKVDPNLLKVVAAEAGLRVGTWKGSLDARALEHEILMRVPELAWVGVNFQGTRACIEVTEKLFPLAEEGGSEPAHIVAAKDGIISEILVLAGQARVGVGDTVRQGDILISGLILPPRENPSGQEGQPGPPALPRLVRARGIVRAKVWYEAEGQSPREEVKEAFTGEHSTTVILRTPDREYILKGSPEPPYLSFRQENRIIKLPTWRNFTFPVELIIVTYFETSVDRRWLSREEAVTRAKEQALLSLRQSLSDRARVLGDRIIGITEEPGLVRVKVLLEVEEDIGQTVNLREPPRQAGS